MTTISVKSQAEVRLISVSKRFGSVTAIDNLSLDINPGELITLLGPSGCGKTTLLRIVAGFYLPDRGCVLIGGTDVTRLPPNRRNTAMVFQSYALFPHMNVYDNVAYGLKIKKLSRCEIAKKVQAVLALVGLTGLEKRFPHQLSGGQQQRVALARALVVEPQVLLLDEPLSNLDAKLRVETREYIRQLQKNLKITSIYVTHDQSEALAISDRIAVLNQGKLQQVGTPDEIYEYPSNIFVANFIGAANIVKAQLVKKTNNVVELSIKGNKNLTLNKTINADVGEWVTIAIRPECLEIVSPNEGDIAGVIVSAQITGAITQYHVDVPPHGTLLVEILHRSGSERFPVGTLVGLKIDLKRIYVFCEGG